MTRLARRARHEIALASAPKYLAILFYYCAALSLATFFQQSIASSVTPTSIFDTASLHQEQQQQQQQQRNGESASAPATSGAQVSHKSPLNGRQFGDTINDIQIECNSNNIVVTLQTNQGFNGMIYPKGLSKNSSCMVEYHQMSANITYHLPLKSCNTMSTEVEDGIEYFNTVMVQPHRRLVTNQGRGYHIRCRYQTKERTITNQEQQLSVNLTQVTPAVMGSAAMPSCTMRIYSAADLSHEVSAENVRIGDELHLIIALDDQDVYGMLVTNCLVRDGMNWGEQPLIDDRGCPVDEEIMPEFVYAKNLTRASVTFQAHKFPYTSSVYYQCNVRLCFREGGCQAHVPPVCGGGASPTARIPSGAGSSRQQHQQHYAMSSNYAKSNNDNNNNNNNNINNNNQPDNLELELANNELARRTSGSTLARSRRWVDAGEIDGVASDELLKSPGAARDLTIEVSSGLHVAEREPESAAAANDDDPLALAATSEEAVEATGSGVDADDAAPVSTDTRSAKERQRSEREFCMSLRRFAIIVSLISLLLMTAIIILIACLIKRRNRRKLDSQLSSTYDHHNNRQQHHHHHNNNNHNHHHHHHDHQQSPANSPYTNRAYCRD